LNGVGKVFHFGKFASGVYIFGQLGRGAPEMIVGKASGMADVGMLSRAQGLVEIFHRLVLRAVLPVCLPFFAKGVRETGSPKPGLLISISYVTAVGWPFLAYMAVAAFAAVRLIYGMQWLAAVPLAKLLCAAAAAELVYVASKEALMASGLVRQSSVLQVGLQLLRIIGLLAVIPWGLEGAAWGLLIAAVFGAWMSHHYLSRHIGLRLHEVVRAVAPSAIVTLVCVAPLAAYVAYRPIDESNYLPVSIIGGLVGATLWLLGLRLTRHPLWPEVAANAAAIMKRIRR
jgi:O-antigen/teichoic acid export membrane protein